MEFLDLSGVSKLWSKIKSYVSDASVASASTLTTARRIDGVTFRGDANIWHHANCSTSASSSVKTVSLANFNLVTNAWLTVKFTVTNTALPSTLKLNVNGTGAKPIKYRNAALPYAGLLQAGRIYQFVYDGEDYELVGDVSDENFSTTHKEIIESMYDVLVSKPSDVLKYYDSFLYSNALQEVDANILVRNSEVYSHVKGSITVEAQDGASNIISRSTGTGGYHLFDSVSPPASEYQVMFIFYPGIGRFEKILLESNYGFIYYEDDELWDIKENDLGLDRNSNRHEGVILLDYYCERLNL